MLIQLVAGLSLVQLVHSHALGDNCTVAQVATNCSGIDHVVCGAETLECSCAVGYTGSNGGTCQAAAALMGACADNGACVDSNAHCPNSTCVCKTGYTGDPCTAICTNETNCGDLDPNAECTGAAGSQTCMCKTGYTRGQGDVCAPISGAGFNTASLWLCISLLLLTTKGVLL